MPIKFGTDGWRAVISDDFTFANVRKVAQAIAQVTWSDFNTSSRLNGSHGRLQPLMVVGYDTRFLSDRYAALVAEVLAANQIRVLLTQASAPTPVVSYAVTDHHADGGVMITASHNPPQYNGIKLKAAYGGSASPEAAQTVETLIRRNSAEGITVQSLPLAQAMEQDLVQLIDPLPAYERHLRTLVDFDIIRRTPLSVVADPMYGAGRGFLRRLLEDAGCQVMEIRGGVNPGFDGGHPEPIARHLQPLLAEIGRGNYHLGLATDGDADRIGAADPDGRFIDPHAIMSLVVDYLVRVRGLRGQIVKTVSSTRMLNLLARRYDLPIHETPVGFNHISDLMLAGDVLLGGEESGGISILGHIPEGDGLLLGLLLAEIVAYHGKGLGLLLDELMASPDIGRFVYARRDQPVQPFSKAALVQQLMAAQPTQLAGQSISQISDRDGVKYILADESWLLIRPSGTEPVLRIYAESHSQPLVEQLLQAGADMAAVSIGQLAH